MRFLIAALVLSASCASAPPPTPVPMVAQDTDLVRLKSGETVSGKIVKMDDAQVAVESAGRLRVFARKDVQESSFAPAKEKLDPVPPVRRGVPPSSWFPKTSPSDKVDVVEVLFFEPHAPESCLGELARPLSETPELTLFAEPGGKIVLSDPRKFGFHAHLEPGNIVRKPVGKPGLTINTSDKVESIVFVSPAQEMKTESHASYAIPDAIVTRVAELSTADATLASLPFAGGKAKETVDGTIWAFSLPRNDRQFWVYLFDGEKRHGKVMQAATVTYGEAVLAPDLVIDMLSADGKVVGRAMLVPMPESIPADGPAPEGVAIRVPGAVEATVAVPPRQSIVLPSKAPATRTDVNVNYYEVSKSIPEKAITAWGIGRPTGEISIRTTPLSPELADDPVKIDLSKLGADRFPAVAWFYHRRTYVWGSGKALESPVPSVSKDQKQTKVITNRGRLAHVVPILFQGPNPPKPAPDSSVDEAVAGGMSSALVSDAFSREAGAAMQTIGNLSSIGGAGGAGGGVTPAAATTKSGDSVSSVTNVYITIPPHTDLGGLGGFDGLGALGGSSGSGQTLKWDPRNYGSSSVSPFLSSNQPWGQGKLGPYSATDPSGTIYDRSGQVTYDPATGALSGLEEWRQQQLAGQGGFNGVDRFAYFFGGPLGAWNANVKKKQKNK